MGCCPATHSSLQGHPAWLGLLWITAKEDHFQNFNELFLTLLPQHTETHFKAFKDFPEDFKPQK